MDLHTTIEITLLSVKIAALACLVNTVPAVLLGWVLATRKIPGKVFVETLVALPMFLPPVATGLALLYLLSSDSPIAFLWKAVGWDNLLLTWQAEVVAAAVIGFPFFVRSTQQAFFEVPERLEILARTFGVSDVRVFLKVSLPLALRGIGYGGALCFGRGLGEFGATSLVGGIIPGKTETLALGIYSRIISSNDREAWVLCLASTVIVGVVVLFANRFLRPKGRRS